MEFFLNKWETVEMDEFIVSIHELTIYGVMSVVTHYTDNITRCEHYKIHEYLQFTCY